MPTLYKPLWRRTPSKEGRIGSRQRRIRMPQRVERPFKFRSREVIRGELVKQRSWWFVEHIRGISRPRVGVEDPNELRAVPPTVVRGSLPERIVYKKCLAMHFVVGADFDFQSSQQGGRMELGGLVADFLFENMKVVIRVQGFEHQEHLRFRKDEEQRLALEEMGYRVYDIDDDTILNESRFEDVWYRIWNMATSVSSGSMYQQSVQAEDPSVQTWILDLIWRDLLAVEIMLTGG